MKTLSFQENLTASENHRGWTIRVDGLRVGEIYPQDGDGNGGAEIVAAIHAALRRTERAEELLVRLANVAFGAGHAELTEADRLAVIEVTDKRKLSLSATAYATHHGKTL